MIASVLNSKFAVIAIIVVILGGLWYGLTSSSAPATSDVLTSAPGDSSGDEAIMQSLLTLQAVNLSGAIFTDPAYATLKDYTTAITPVPAGRPDPFAPLPVTIAPAAASAIQSAQIFKPTK